MCCFTETKKENLVYCTANHHFCKGCMTSLLEHALSKKKPLECVSMDEQDSICVGGFSCATIDSVDPDLSKHYWSMLTRTYALDTIKKGTERFIQCHNCPHGIVNDEKSKEKQDEDGRQSRISHGIFICGECSSRTCIRCSKKQHDGRCSTRNWNAIREAIKNTEEVIFCKCGERFTKEKDGSCNKIVCTCGRAYCYICGTKLPKKSPYFHFKEWPDGLRNQSGTCPLFGGEKKKYGSGKFFKAIRFMTSGIIDGGVPPY